MRILAIDPGCTESAWLVYEGGKIRSFGKDPNEKVLYRLDAIGGFDTLADPQHLAIEMVASYGMSVGQTVFDTCLWIGRFVQAFQRGNKHTLVYRKDVKMHLCGSMKAKDGNIRQALIDRYGPPGTKKSPGATYGISKDVWSALAVATYYADTTTVSDGREIQETTAAL